MATYVAGEHEEGQLEERLRKRYKFIILGGDEFRYLL